MKVFLILPALEPRDQEAAIGIGLKTAWWAIQQSYWNPAGKTETCCINTALDFNLAIEGTGVHFAQGWYHLSEKSDFVAA